MMKGIDPGKRNIGINFNKDGTAVATVWSPLAEKIDLALNTKTIALEKNTEGYWQTHTDKIIPGSLYKIRINGNLEFPDPASLSQPHGVHQQSEAIDTARFQWSDDDWQNHALEDYLIYELHTGTFSAQGSFTGIEEKLGHLLDLGITAIELMPLAQFPGCRNWGYDGVFPFAVQNSYGGAEGLQHLVNTCHQHGLAVILDVVYNHLGPEGNYLRSLAPYFTGKYKTPWGDALNFDDAWSDGVRRYFIENALMWFRDFHVDALRLDAVHAIKDFSPVHILREIKIYTDRLMQQTGRRHYLIAECDLNDPRFINSLDQCGYGMDAQWIDEFHHALRVAATGERAGYYSDFSGVQDLAKAYKHAYVYTGQFSPHRKKHFGVPTDNPGRQFVVFAQNHDQVGNRMKGDRIGHGVSFEMKKLLAGAVIVAPFLPLIFMGEEWNETNPFLYFVSHTDPQLVEAVRSGRKKEFAAFHFEGEAPDPVAVESFLRSKLQWDLKEKNEHRIMFNYYKSLLAVRKKNDVLRFPGRENLEAGSDTNKQTVLLKRWNAETRVICLMNFSSQQQTIRIPRHPWKKIFDSAAPEWNGPASSPGQLATEAITLQPESILIYSSHV